MSHDPLNPKMEPEEEWLGHRTFALANQFVRLLNPAEAHPDYVQLLKWSIELERHLRHLAYASGNPPDYCSVTPPGEEH